MITNFKIFEKKNEPKEGDWVYCIADSSYNSDEIVEFTLTHIGQIIDIRWDGYDIYDVQYTVDEKPFFLHEDSLFSFERKDIKFWSKNKEDVELYLQSKRYNL